MFMVVWSSWFLGPNSIWGDVKRIHGKPWHSEMAVKARVY